MNIAIVGMSGFPYRKEAAVSRLKMMMRAIVEDGGSVFCLNRHALADGMEAIEKVEGVEVQEASGSRIRQNNFLRRNLGKLILPFREWRQLSRWHASHRLDALQVYTQEFLPIIFYATFAKLNGCTLWLHYVELRSKFEGRKNIWKRFNDKLLDGFALRLFDGFYPISTLLSNHVTAANPNAVRHQVPPICDFEEFEQIPALQRERPFLLYCGSLAYSDVVKFVLECWEALTEYDGHELILVLGGEKSAIRKYREETAHLHQVVILNGLEYSTLVGLYKAATGLLIPLRPNLQDMARFPQKICEYVASAGLVVTTDVGEVGAFFQDEVNALVAKEYNIVAYSAKMQEAITDRIRLRSITKCALEKGKTNFDWRSYKRPLHQGVV